MSILSPQNLIQKGKTIVNSTVRNGLENIATATFPGGMTGVKAASDMIRENRKARLDKAHKASQKDAKNTVDENEFEEAIKGINEMWSWNPFQMAGRLFNFIVPGLSNADVHTDAVKALTAYGSQNDAKNFAFRAVTFILAKMSKIASVNKGLIGKVIGSTDAVLKEYEKAATTWIGALSTESESDQSIVTQFVDDIDEIALPDGIKAALTKAIESKRDSFAKVGAAQ